MLPRQLIQLATHDPHGDSPVLFLDALPDSAETARILAALANRPLGGVLHIRGNAPATGLDLAHRLRQAAGTCEPVPVFEILTEGPDIAVFVPASPAPTRIGGCLSILASGQVREGSLHDTEAVLDARGDTAYDVTPLSQPISRDDDKAPSMCFDDVRTAATAEIPTADGSSATIAGAWVIGRSDVAPPALSIRVQQWRNSLSDAAGRNGILDRELSYGPPAAETVQLLSLQIAADLTSAPVRPSHALPSILWELLANAIIHRSYSPTYSDRPIHVLQYTNAVIVDSPGPVPLGHVRYDGSAIEGMWSRNLRLADLLRQ